MREISYTEPVPMMGDPLRYENTDFAKSEFVEIFADDIFDVQMQYPKLGMTHAEEKCMVRKEVYEKLLEAAKLLPEGYKLRILDAWRPFALQEELHEKYSKDIIRDFGLEKLSAEERNRVICRFVSEPNCDRALPPVHTTGGAVDVTLLDKDGNELRMGTSFDAFSDKTHTAFFENQEDIEVRNNRRLLYNVMINAGFTNLPSEWWHYDYGDQIWAFYAGKPAIYRGVFTQEEIYGDEG